ncbi:ferritin-like fold-containing protein [Microbacterium sp.]|uniref:ferritin-like fold-containing protein n=1 Tax=Microbacterium sp. TaxID=51671 RepID=UPI0028117A90|nr:ferritin-like fold-containing protein [Microbacterium sp.]
MVNWTFWRRRPPARMLRLRSRGEMGDAKRVDFEELAPAVETFLGQAAYLQLGYFETLTRLIRATPDLREKEALSLAAGAALVKHRAIIDVIRDRGEEPAAIMRPFQEQLDGFRRATIGARPRETMLSVHITAGMLDDFYRALAASYGETGRRVARILNVDSDRELIVDLIRATIDDDDEMRSLLSMWARRLVGDTLLVARAALRPQRLGVDDEKKVEPVFTALMAAHARRMDALGLAS